MLLFKQRSFERALFLSERQAPIASNRVAARCIRRKEQDLAVWQYLQTGSPSLPVSRR